MKFLIAICLLWCAVANAHHTPEHSLKGPLFVVGKTHRYEGTLNMTSGIPGLSNQVAKTVLKFDILVNPLSETEHLLKMEHVKVSEGVYAVDSDDTHVTLRANTQLQEELQKPVKFTLIDGEITKYTLDPRDSVVARKIKKGVLRNLEFTVRDRPEEQLTNEASWEDRVPYTYNVTKDTTMGKVQAFYVVNWSPYPDFPYESRVFNVSKTENYEPLPYLAVHKHHNFARQGCPEVCNDHEDCQNRYSAGCPLGHEPHHSPLKMTATQHVHFSLREGKMVPEIVEAEEKHTASMYDQDMVIRITALYRLKHIKDQKITEPREQTTHHDLHDLSAEYSEKEVQDFENRISYLADEKCGVERREDAKPVVEELLKELSEIVVRGDLSRRDSQQVGEKIILLQKALTLLDTARLEEVSKNIVQIHALKNAEEKEKVKRQIWLDILPLIGTPEAVEYIKNIIKANEVSHWEAKEILEALPSNIMYPSEKIIRDLHELLKENHVKNVHLLFSATHIALAKVIERACIARNTSESRPYLKESQSEHQRELEELQKLPFAPRLRWTSSYNEALNNMQQAKQDSQWQWSDRCPRRLVKEIIEELSDKLSKTSKIQKKVIYIEALSRMGVAETIRVIVPYAYGIADDVQEYQPADIDFLKTVTIYSLHNLVGYYHEEVLRVVIPIYFNKTESPRVRNGAFSVILRGQPSLSLLQHIAQDSWQEPSREVGSYVYSALESFGNSSLPCMQLTAKRIQKVISQTKRIDIGNHHAKSILMTYFDNVRNFGIEKRFAYTPSNESIIPNTWYSSVMYNSDSFRDVLIQFALNVQGINQEDLMKMVDLSFLSLRTPKDIPRNKAESIFGNANVVSRLPKELRVTIFRKMFYSNSYYYFDASTINADMKPLREHVNNILTLNRGIPDGHFVKLIIPSSYRTIAAGKMLSYPLEFEMKHPTLFAVRVHSKEVFNLNKFEVELRPSVYHTTRYTLHFKNLLDCKSYGVLHEQKMTTVYPIHVRVEINALNDIEITYKMPKLPKMVTRYSSESVTYAGQEKLQTLPSEELRRPITSIPIQFKKEKVIRVLGMPPVHVELLSEDIKEEVFEVPRNWNEAVHIATTTLRNAGWTRRSVNVSMLTNSEWPVNTEVTIKLRYNKDHRRYLEPEVRQQSSSQQWPQQQQAQQKSVQTESDPQLQTCWTCKQKEQEKTVKDMEILLQRISQIPYFAHELDVQLESKPSNHRAHFRVEYNHTFDRRHNWIIVNASAEAPHHKQPCKFNMVNVMTYENRPNEFEYDIQKYGKQKAYIYNVMNFCGKDALETPEIVFAGKFDYKPVEKMLENELSESPEAEYFYPESHKECVHDITEGKSQTPACIRAVREEAIYNNLELNLKWMKTVPDTIKNITSKVDQALKFWYYSQMEQNRVDVNNPENTLELYMEYINKLTDTPVVNAYIKTPKENIKYKKVNPAWILPLSSVEGIAESYIHRATNNTLWPTCTIMEKYVRTYDQKTYRLPENTCTYIMSTQCLPRKKFAVMSKTVSPNVGTKEIEMFISEHEIHMTPAQNNKYNLKFDGRQYVLESDISIYLDEESEIHAYVVPMSEGSSGWKKAADILVIHADKVGIRVRYDGKNIQMQVNPRYKGELCGLCSEYDGEETREFRGVDQCLYEQSYDFAMQSIVDADQCGADMVKRGQWFCENGEGSHYAPTPVPESDSSYERPEFRNQVVQRNEYSCFSTSPIPVCQNDQRPQETESWEVDFHCLPKNDVTAKKLAVEAKRRVLSELANKSVDFTETIEVAKHC